MPGPGIRRNKRKSLEPRKLQSYHDVPTEEIKSSDESSEGAKLYLRPSAEKNKLSEETDWSQSQSFEPGRFRLNSTGSEERSPPLFKPEPDKGSRTPSPIQNLQYRLIPHSLGSRKKFRFDSLSDLVTENPTREKVGLLPRAEPGSSLLRTIQPIQEEPLDLILPKPGKSEHWNGARTRSREVSKRNDVAKDNLQQKNYKNTTRMRRIEANARERQRVHTITAAFDTLQAAIPSEDENIKLSKLSVIKIATAYIMALSRMAGYDYTEDRSAPSLESVLEHCRETIHTESRIKKRV